MLFEAVQYENRLLTWMKVNFTKKQPLGDESELQPDVTSQLEAKVNRYIASGTNSHIGHIKVFNSISTEMTPTNTKEYSYFWKNLQMKKIRIGFN